MINYSAIPVAKAPSSPWTAFKWAVLVTFSIIAVMGLGALVTTLVGHRDGVMQFIGLMGVAGLITLVIVAFIKGARGFDKQRQWMQKFAKDNNWQYDQSKRNIGDLASYPPLYSEFALRWNSVRCTVSGKLGTTSFELAHVTYIQTSGMLGTLIDLVDTDGIREKYRFAWTSVLRLEGHPILQEDPALIYEKDESHTYVICGMNALYKHDIKAMFDSVCVME